MTSSGAGDTLGVRQSLNQPAMFQANGTEIQTSRRKLLYVFAGGVLLTWMAWSIVFDGAGNLNTFNPKYWVAVLGLIFFGFGTVVTAWQSLFGNKLMYVISPKGVWLASRGGGTAVPWESVSAINKASIYRQKFLVLEMTKESYQSLDRGPIARTFFKMNGLLGIDGIPLSASATNVSLERLEEVLSAHRDRWKFSQKRR